MKTKLQNLKVNNCIGILVVIVFTLLNLKVFAADNIRLTNLRTEYKVNPIGIGTELPRLRWEILSGTKDFLQTAYEIRTAASRKDLLSGENIFWDSGKIESDQSNQVVYKGPKLKSGERVYWQVKVWGNNGESSKWSEPMFWEMGLLNISDWSAKWIVPDLKEESGKANPCPYLRKEFKTNKKIVSARAYVTSHGLYELHINGKKISDRLFTPGWTSYNKHLQYQTYDVTSEVQNGNNALGVILADGWYRNFRGYDRRSQFYGDQLGLLLQLKIVYDDGSTQNIISDDSWKSSYGPILMSSIYDGETYDARREMNGWDKPGFNDASWNKTTEKNYSMDMIVSTVGPPVRITETVKPIKKFTAPNGDLIFDMGQNMVGFVEIKLKGNAGDKIILRHGEVLDQDGNLYTANLRSAEQKIEYIFKGNGIETYEPHFTFQGFRYVAVTKYPGEISLDDINGKVVHSDMTFTGSFECSDNMINQLQHNIQWGLKGNFLDVPTDCPQRDERMGWTGDAQAFAPTACFNVDAATFYTKWMKDFTADQKKDGAVPWVIPDLFDPAGGEGNDNHSAATGWADASVIVPWTVYRNYGDIRILESQYETMKKWVNYMRAQAGDTYLWTTGSHFGDWLAYATTRSDYPGATTDKDFLATSYFYYSTSILQKTAKLLGKENDAKDFSDLMKKIKSAFQKEYITPNGRLSSNTQTAYVLALAFDLYPENMRANAAKRLADDVLKFGHITTGFLGTPLICEVLSDNGYAGVAYKLLFRKQYPSWLYPITMGATTIWERWDGIKPDGSFQDVGMNSFNHYAYGAVGKWLYSYVAGIRIDPNIPGYKKIISEPFLTDSLKYAKAEYHSIYGDIVSSWKNNNGSILMDVEIPPNTTADVFLPANNGLHIFENGKPLNKQKDVELSESDNGKTIVKIGSGKYRFEIRE